MRFWQHTATFLALALIAAIIVFAGHDRRTVFVSGGDTQLTKHAAAKMQLRASGLTASAPIKRADVSE
jgi:cytochrome c-type biogenesis protein CcmE